MNGEENDLTNIPCCSANEPRVNQTNEDAYHIVGEILNEIVDQVIQTDDQSEQTDHNRSSMPDTVD